MHAKLNVKPSDCVFVSCVPSSRPGYLCDLADSRKEFVRSQFPVWQKYDLEVATPLRRLITEASSWGVAVVEEAPLAKFKAVYVPNPPKVVILFAHWRPDAVEFADGFAGAGEIIEAIPPTFSGFLDLCVCHPKRLADELQWRRPHCITKQIQAQALPAIWLNFYLVLFRYLQGETSGYLSAFEVVAREFLHLGSVQ